MQKFKKYVKQFDFNNEKIKYKYYHSFRVKRLSEYLSKKLELDKSDRKLASFIGLYHDIGRFNQITKYNTFIDEKSIDHGDEGFDLLKKLDFLDKFNKEEKTIILKSIKNHNKYKIEKFLNDRELLHVKIIRDTDKLDIIRMISRGKIFDFNKLECNISKDIEEKFLKYELIKNNNSNIDNKLLRDLSLIFDINFNESIRYIKRKKYFDKIYQKIENKEYYKKYFDEINKYIEMRSKLC